MIATSFLVAAGDFIGSVYSYEIVISTTWELAKYCNAATKHLLGR
jgi:hypothetical protein